MFFGSVRQRSRSQGPVNWKLFLLNNLSKPFHLRTTNFICWLPLFSRRSLVFLASVGQRARSQGPVNWKPFPLNNLSTVSPIDFKLKNRIPFGVSRSKVKVRGSVPVDWKPFLDDNFGTIWPTDFKLHILIALIEKKNPIVFGVSRTKVKVTRVHNWKLFPLYNLSTLWDITVKHCVIKNKVNQLNST